MAKVHCLYGMRLDDGDYSRLLQKRTIAEIAGYLKNETYFSGALTEVKEDLVHREQLESLVEQHMLNIYLRLSKYSYDDKLFFTMYRMKNEIEQLLFAMRLLNAGEINKFIVSLPVYLAKHLSIDLFAIAKAKNYDDLLTVVEHSDYYNIIGRFRPSSIGKPVDIPACESSLLTYFYARILDMVRENYDAATRKHLERLLHYQIDFHNVSLIYRMKRYFNGTSKSIAGYLLPIHARLGKKAYLEMLDAPDVSALTEILKRYKSSWLYPDDDLTGGTEQMIVKIQRQRQKITRNVFRFSFKPVVVVVCYMTLMNIEAHNIINIIEGTRYNVSPEEIRAMLVI